MFEGNNKKLILVGDEKSDVYCEFMSMLISSNDDVIDDEGNVTEVIGVLDGSIDSAIWTSDIYRDNRAHTSSKQKILFIGKTESSSNVIPNLIVTDNDIRKYGVTIGWLGNKAVIDVDSKIILESDAADNLYNEFFNKYINISKRFNHNIKNLEEQITKLNKQRASVNKVTKNVASGSAGVATATAIGTGVVALSLVSAAGIGLAIPAAIIFKKNKDNKKELTEQLFRYAILKFYFDYLASFMEM